MRGVLRSFCVALWFMVLTFPLMGIKLIPATGQVMWRFENVALVGGGVFLFSFLWRWLLVRKSLLTAEEADLVWLFTLMNNPRTREWCLAFVAFCHAAVPLVSATLGLRGATFTPGLVLWIAACLVITVVILAGWRNRVSTAARQGVRSFAANRPLRAGAGLVCLVLMVGLVFVVDTYRINVLISTFIWVMLGLGLNIVVGQAGMLVLGYVAFYAVGAYSYALGNQLLGEPYMAFWILLPVGGFLAAMAGIVLSLPVLRLKGDYLAIVTLGFGEILRVTLEGGSLSLQPVADLIHAVSGYTMPDWFVTPLQMGGPAGIAAIPPPRIPGVEFDLDQSARFLYFVALAFAVLTIFVVSRLRDSRLGRSWAALREDEIACEAMGINKVSVKLSAFALGACWAGFGGVLFAAKTSFINPASFTFMESALILSVVVLGGLGSILGVVLGAAVLILLPEYLRSFDEYRMLIFGASMVLMMVFRPQGLIIPQARHRAMKPAGRKGEAGGAA